MKKIKIIAVILLFGVFLACKKDKEIDLDQPVPTVTDIEFGSKNQLAMLGRDFHFQANILAGEKIKDARIKIVQKNNETYASPWTFELIWPLYVGLKNATIHEHFKIPREAPVGNYEIVLVVLDDNGTKTEIKEPLRIVDPVDFPVDPKIEEPIILVLSKTKSSWKESKIDEPIILKKGEEVIFKHSVTGIKDDGIFYSLLIKQSANYHPEIIDNLDFSKVIVIRREEHKDHAYPFIYTGWYYLNGHAINIEIGAQEDNDYPTRRPINGDKKWESGQYNWVILYKNTTHNVSTYKSIPLTIDYN